MTIANEWRRIVQDAFDEFDLATLEKKVQLAEEAIFLRFQALDGNGDHHQERREMIRASEDLLRLKTERLGWPPIKLGNDGVGSDSR